MKKIRVRYNGKYATVLEDVTVKEFKELKKRKDIKKLCIVEK